MQTETHKGFSPYDFLMQIAEDFDSVSVSYYEICQLQSEKAKALSRVLLA